MHASRSILILLTGATLFADSCSAFATDVESLIKRQSQEFSDASASGDAAVLARYLDDRVVFMNETGEIATKKDIVDSASPSPNGQQNALTQTDFKLEMHGSVAVTSFTDVLTQHFHGQTLHAKFLSTEVWLNEGGNWRMISSQTMTKPEDPPAVALPDALLNEYVGTYQAGSDLIYTIAHEGDGLTARVGTDPPAAIKAELKDVLFTPGQGDRRKIFQRDANGKVTGFFSRNEGRDIWFKRVG